MPDLVVYIEPNYSVPDRAEGGIRRVVEAQYQYLPEFGVRPVKDPQDAQVLAGHAVMLPEKPGVPFVSHCHGLHWREYAWPRWAQEVNRDVVASMSRADAITAPSQWVAHAISYGMLRRPEVIYHGVDAEDWACDGSNGGYVLWNKARQDPVSDATQLQQIARRMRDVPFMTTIGMPADNVTITGVMPLPDMKPIIQRAGVYLATARETFGIGTLEAMAAGVPVAGWDYGGQSEIIIPGETGWLAPYGDWAALEDCIRRCLANRVRMGKNAAADAKARWGWRSRIQQYAELYKQVWFEFSRPCPRVSVVVPCHNLGQYLGDALLSVAGQDIPDWECIIVDDASTDDTPRIAKEFTGLDPRFKYVRTSSNVKLCAALNEGFAHSTGKYILNLDADNILVDGALRVLADALDRDRTLHIVYGSLDTMNKDGSNRKRNDWPPLQPFDWYGQLQHLNQIPSGAMVRRSVRVESGGYRERMWRAEDAEFWARVTSLGFRAQRVTEESIMVYRWRDDSKSSHEAREFGGDGDWTAWFPWGAGARSGTEGLQLRQQGQPWPRPDLVPVGAQAAPRSSQALWWDISHAQEPVVSVVIPVGPGHERLVLDALDSLVAQDVHDWEAVVVNNTGHTLDLIPGAPYARIINATGPKMQVGAARNRGVEAARGRLIYFLDADDYLAPGGLRLLLEMYAAGDAGYVYSDYWEIGPEHTQLLKEMPDYDQGEWRNMHSINVLLAKADVLRVGGFDEGLQGWEDWEFFIRCAVEGVCGQRLPAPAWCYRKHTGTRRDESLSMVDSLLPILRERYAEYYNGGRAMSKCCGGNADELLAAKRSLNRLYGDGMGDGLPSTPAVGAPAPAPAGRQLQVVRLEFIGPGIGAISFFGAGGRTYRGGNNPADRYADVAPEDVDKLVNSGFWRRPQAEVV